MKRILEYLLYGNIYIGICAACLTGVTQMWYGQWGTQWTYLGFVFFGTVTLYGIHRLVGLRLIKNRTGRFAIVGQLHEAIFLTTGISGLGTILCLSQIPWIAIKALWLPILLSVLYVAPILPGKKRMRDLPYLKVFVLSFVWAWLTHHVPSLMYGLGDHLDSGLFFERYMFILAITLPFDIRDYEIDLQQGTRTLAHGLGLRGIKIISQIALFAGVLSLTSIGLEHPPFQTSAYACIGGYLLAYILIIFSTPKRPDWYYLFGLDGTMIALFVGNFLLTQ